MVIQGVAYPSDFEAKKAMIEIGRRLEEKNYAIAGDGSISVRTGPNVVWVTVKGADKGALTQDCFVRVDMNGKQMMSAHPRILPDDMALHLKVYAENAEIQSVIHAYPARAVAVAAAGAGLPAADYSPAVRALGQITVVSGGSPEAAAQAAALQCKTDSGVLLQGGGCVLWGKNVSEAYHRIQALDYSMEVRSTLQPASVPCPSVPSVPAAPVRPLPAAIPTVAGLTPLVTLGDRTFRPLVDTVRPEPPHRVTPSPAPAAPAAANTQALVKDTPRAQVMAEVVRRTLAQMK